MGFYYLATPYSKYPDGLEAAFKIACEQAAILVRHGVKVYSPIAHTHPIAIYGGIDPLSHAIWLPADRPFMDLAKGLIVLKAKSWELSYGIAEERKHFEALGKPVLWMEPGALPEGVEHG